MANVEGLAAPVPAYIYHQCWSPESSAADVIDYLNGDWMEVASFTIMLP